MVLVVKSLPASTGDLGSLVSAGSIPALGRSLGGVQGNPLQCSLLENPMDGGAWWDTAYRFAKSQTQLR